jgi:carboxymethylenebutenolidase
MSIKLALVRKAEGEHTMSKTIELKAEDGKEFSAYLALPEGGRGPGMLVIQEIFGVNKHIREVCDLHAQLGFVAMAPDIFFRIKPGLDIGYTEAEMQEGFSYYQKLDFEQAVEDLASCVTSMKAMPEVVAKVGCVGYCMGGQLAFRLAAKNAVDASVSYYGGGLEPYIDQASNLKTPLLMHFAEKDDYIPASTVEKVREALADKRDTAVYLYPGVDHGFNCDQRGAFDRASAMIAIARSNWFLHKHLG